MASATATTESPAPSGRDWGVAAAVLAASQLFLLGRVLFLDAALHGRDVLHHYWPLHEAVRRALAEGRLPAWDVGVQGGMPLLANPHAGVFYPPNLLYQLLEFPRAYAVLLAVHGLLLGLGTWALLRHFVGQPAALGGALALTLCGPVASLNSYGPLLGSLCWTPWALHVQLSARPKAWRAASLGALLALQVLGGDPMPALFTGLLSLGALGLFRRERSAVGVLALGYAVGGLLSAVQALPSIELLGQSVRATGGAALGWSMHPARLLELVLPDLFGHYLEVPGFWGNFLSNGPVRIPFLLSAYFGAAAATAALAGAKKSPLFWFGLGAFGVGLVLALGGRAVAGPLLTSVPPFSFFRYPEKYLLLAAFGWAALVAAGLEAAQGGGRRKVAMFAVAALALLALLGSGPLSAVLRAWLEPTLTRPGSRAPMEVALTAVGEAGLTALGFAALVALLAPTRWLPAPRAAWLWVAVLTLDLLLSAQRTVWTGPIELYRERPPLANELFEVAAQKPFRLFRDNTRLEQGVQKEGTYEGMADRRAFDALTLKSTVGAVWGVEDISASPAVVLARWAAFVAAFGPRQARALELANVCVAIAPGDGPLARSGAARPVGQLPFGAAVLALDGCRPRLWFVDRPREAESLEAALRAVTAEGFDLSAEAAIEGAGVSSGPGARVLSSTFEPSGAARAQLSAPQGGVLIYAATWFPGWQAMVDGRPARLFTADGTLIGVEVPAGAKEFAIAFSPTRLSTGLWLSVAGFVLLLTLWGFGRLSRIVSKR